MRFGVSAPACEKQVGVERDACDGGDCELHCGGNGRGRDEAFYRSGDGEQRDAAYDELRGLAPAQAQVVEARDVTGEQKRRAEEHARAPGDEDAGQLDDAMTGHEGQKLVAVAGAVREREERADVHAVDGHVEERADAEERAVGEGVEGDLYVVRGDSGGRDLVRLVDALPPARLPL